jgi:bleomycin hydrolase
MCKRLRESTDEWEKNSAIDDRFITKCENYFNSDPVNIFKRNCINAVGCSILSTNSTRLNEISHTFLNSIKRRSVKATNQGDSGRCWMFSGLNSFRHVVINDLSLSDFEFSQVYLFFWDKFERSNSYLMWFIQNPEERIGSRAYDFMVDYYMSDGGYWNTFANLVDKYGVLPSECMKETYQSENSGKMNHIIRERLESTINHFWKFRHKLTVEDKHKIRQNVLKEIYLTLVKFLGEPPKKFSFIFNRDEADPFILSNISAKDGLTRLMGKCNISNDFVMLMNCPTPDMKFYRKYRIKYTSNVYDGSDCIFINLPIHELSKYAMNSITKGFPVWFACDISHSFNTYHSVLDDRLDDKDKLFGEVEDFSKGERMYLRNVEASHAMTITGFNIDKGGKPTEWQVENSWGYYDSNTPGRDGFLYMSQSWFEKYVIEIVVQKRFLSRTILKIHNSDDVIELNPWDSCAPSLKVGGKGRGSPPKDYLERLK